ncbi:hypothetical protein HCN44_005165 [Aphidius gifuensis]|uniref:Peptidase M12B domain-containing protein n=1 Tax=Aphidius gifuensis TaxID=684658 RepID=A0A834XXV8_APHGI|nr:snake venom metalloproteinase ACLF-like [Aphidius gifuensis]KAF7992821.1 hypothetical protein HCN44_005165 [Aphidius gifuensis]
MWNIFLLSLIAMVLPSDAIHRRMTREEKTFHLGTADESKLPEYNVVEVHFLHKRETGETTVQLKPFGKALEIILEPSVSAFIGDDTPMWEMDEGDSGPTFTKLDNVWDQVAAELYTESTSSSSVLIAEDVDPNGKKKRSILSGVMLQHGLAITSLPERFHNEFSNSDNSNVETDESSFELIPEKNSEYHIVYKITEVQKDSITNTENIKSRKRRYNYDSYDASVAPDILYVETLFILDKYFMDTFNNDQIKALTFLIPFWHGVNHLYRIFKKPEIRFTIAGIIFCTNEKSLTYISDYRLREGVNINKIVVASGRFWYEQSDSFPFDTYDYLVTMTLLPLCDDSSCLTMGYAGLEYMCVIRLNWALSSMTITNKYGYNDIISAAHEVAHSFGLEHDEDYGCMEGTGIMSAFKPEDRITAPWSRCSLNSLNRILHTRNFTCLYNKPADKGTPMPRYLPKEFSDAEDKLSNNDK